MTRSEHIGLALLVLASAITVLAHPFPPTNDASSHLATAVAFRGVLLDDPAVTAWYAFDATPLPYWLPTLLMQPLLALFEPLLAWRILMVAYLVALPLSWSFLLRTAAPQSAPLALLGALCAFNWAYWLGEAAFLLGLPLTLVSYALYLGLERTRSRRFVVFLLAALATYLSHVFALAALFGAVGLHLLLRRGGAARAQWVAAAAYLGCLSIGVNAAGGGAREELAEQAADGLRGLCEFADPHDVNVIVENHGGWSSHGAWLAGVIASVDHPRCGTLPDFGNFRISGKESYDPYRGVEELMPFAKGVSAKSHDFDPETGEETRLDYSRLLDIVAEAGYTGFIGVEYEGSRLSEQDGIRATKALLERYQEAD